MWFRSNVNIGNFRESFYARISKKISEKWCGIKDVAGTQTLPRQRSPQPKMIWKDNAEWGRSMAPQVISYFRYKIIGIREGEKKRITEIRKNERIIRAIVDQVYSNKNFC